jgi:DNA-binding protein H-NS
MIDPRAADHAVGLELQIEELVEQRQRALVQDRPEDAAAIEAEISALQMELAEHIERATAAAVEAEAPVVAAPEAEEAAGGAPGEPAGDQGDQTVGPAR